MRQPPQPEQQPGNAKAEPTDNGEDEALEAMGKRLQEQFALPDHSESRMASQFLATAETVSIIIESVTMVPATVGSTRVSLSFVIPSGRTLAVSRNIIPLASVQDEASPAAAPMFRDLQTIAPLTPKTLVVLSVACIDKATRRAGTLGHVVIPLWSKRGAFEVRLLRGPLDTVVSEITVPALPLVTVKYRLNEPAVQREYFRSFDYTPDELALLAERKPDPATPADLGLRKDAAEGIFRAAFEGQTMTPYDLSGFAQYNPRRGLAVCVHAILFAGLEPPAANVGGLQRPTLAAAAAQGTADCVLYKVTCDVMGAPGGAQFTDCHDWVADVHFPMFLEKTFRFVDVPAGASLTVACLMRIFAMRPVPARPTQLDGLRWEVVEFGWTVLSLLDPVGYPTFRPAHGFPLFAGKPPPDIASLLRTASAEKCLADLLGSDRISPARPSGDHREPPTIIVSTCDGARVLEVVPPFPDDIPALPPVVVSLRDGLCGDLLPFDLQHASNAAFIEWIGTVRGGGGQGP